MINEYDYMHSYKSEDFELTEPWTFTIEGVQLTWAPNAPFIFSDGSADGNLIAEQLIRLIESANIGIDSTFPATPTGPDLLAHPSAPYTVLYAINEIYGDEPELLSFSENAPKLSDLNEDDENTDDKRIIY